MLFILLHHIIFITYIYTFVLCVPESDINSSVEAALRIVANEMSSPDRFIRVYTVSSFMVNIIQDNAKLDK